MTTRSDSPQSCDLGTLYGAITQALLRWYGARRRDLPWRNTRDPYRIWVAEIMLQQTQASTVLPYYARFVGAFPTVRALAAAELDQVLLLWGGLGYYSRARNMHRAARIIYQKHQGQLPGSFEALQELPGIGEHTAGAIASIAFGQDVPAIDGHAVRVLCRLFDYNRDPRDAEGRRMMHRYAETLLPAGKAGDFGQAMTELGTLLCLSRNPLCDDCPVAEYCWAREIPHKEWVVALVERQGRILIVRRVPEGLLGGLWELPSCEGSDVPRERTLRQRLSIALGLQLVSATNVAMVRHAYTHFRITAHVYRVQVVGEPHLIATWDQRHWLAAREMSRFAFTGMTNKILDSIPWPGTGLLF